MMGIYMDEILIKEQRMQGWKIFTHSMRMVFENMGPALRISGLLYAVYVAVDLYFRLNYLDDWMVFQLALALDIIPPVPPRGFFPTMVLNFIVALSTSFWIAVLWHRFVLLSEAPKTVFPPFYSDVFGRYFWRMIQLALMVIAFGFVLLMLLGLALGPLLGDSAGMVIKTIMMGAVLYLSYRFGLVFPAVALNMPISFKTSWTKTEAASGAIGQLAVVGVMASIIIQIPSSMNSDPISVINLTYSYVVGWFAMMIGISVLTTLYGIYIEGREL